MRKAEETNTETPQRENTENSPKGAIEKNRNRETQVLGRGKSKSKYP